MLSLCEHIMDCNDFFVGQVRCLGQQSFTEDFFRKDVVKIAFDLERNPLEFV
jgi:hypothetical protein